MPQHDHLRSIHEETGTAILDTARGVLSTLNPTGGFIWQSLRDGTSEDEIVRVLVAETDGAADIIAKDVNEFRRELEAHALIPQAAARSGYADDLSHT